MRVGHGKRLGNGSRNWAIGQDDETVDRRASVFLDTIRTPQLLDHYVGPSNPTYVKLLLTAFLDRTLEDIDSLPKPMRTVSWEVARTIAAGAIAGSRHMIAEFLNRTEGRPRESLTLDGNVQVSWADAARAMTSEADNITALLTSGQLRQDNDDAN